MSTSDANSAEAAAIPKSPPPTTPLFVDIGANLLDDMYRGVYRDKPRHEPDLPLVLDRAWSNNLDKVVISAGNLQESKDALKLAREDARTFSTVGVHPTRCGSFGTTEEELEAYVTELTKVARDGMEDGTVAALGELGLDYARTEFCDKETQRRGFLAQLRIAKETGLPLFLHNRETGTDLLELLREHRGDFTRGVVHSFDDTAELAAQFIELDLYIGINGCSLKTQDNLNVINTLPLERILLETDCPWCDIRATHAGHGHVKTTFPTKKEKQYEPGCCVKGRYEPCHIVQVAEVVAGVKGVEVARVAEHSRRNAYEFFGGLVKK